MNKKTVTITIFSLQILYWIIVLLGDIGFDKPGKLGLDFGHFLFFSITYLIIFLYGIISSSYHKKWLEIISQTCLLIIGITILFTCM